MTAKQIRVKAAKKAQQTMAAYTGKDLKELQQARHNAAVKAWETRRAKTNGKKTNGKTNGKANGKKQAKPAIPEATA